ncbi:hypothetical protein ACIBEJ_51515 [Nonomuraea sp. NPDC050790]|uniref:hypothetical protein n=1 Tax=Nonomuraea sp. NPDC050790 TaxID=3364371 RepID=UPI003796FAC4
MIADTQASGIGQGKGYIDRLQGEGKSRTEAIRLLRRRISDIVHHTLKTVDTTAAIAQNSPSQALTT